MAPGSLLVEALVAPGASAPSQHLAVSTVAAPVQAPPPARLSTHRSAAPAEHGQTTTPDLRASSGTTGVPLGGGDPQPGPQPVPVPVQPPSGPSSPTESVGCGSGPGSTAQRANALSAALPLVTQHSAAVVSPTGLPVHPDTRCVVRTSRGTADAPFRPD